MIFIHEMEESLLLASLEGFVEGLFWDIGLVCLSVILQISELWVPVC